MRNQALVFYVTYFLNTRLSITQCSSLSKRTTFIDRYCVSANIFPDRIYILVAFLTLFTLKLVSFLSQDSCWFLGETRSYKCYRVQV